MKKSIGRSHWRRNPPCAIAAKPPIVGPCLAAVRAAVSDVAGLQFVFDRIGRYLDLTLSEPRLDNFIIGNEHCLVVAISDVTWRDSVAFQSYGAQEVSQLVSAARVALNEYAAIAGASARYPDFIGGAWAIWSDHVHSAARSGGLFRCNQRADVCVGLLLDMGPSLRDQIDRIAGSGMTPVVVVALNSKGTKPKRIKCKVRAAVFALPDWARAAGTVAGCA